jgi:CheY-like chemotaxis protein
MDGLVFTQHYRRDEGDGAHMPIIALTAHDNEELRQQCFMVGMDEFLLKPVDRQVLSAVIQQHLQR